MTAPEPAPPSLARELAPWVLGALLIVLVVLAALVWTAPADNLLHQDYEIL